MTHLPLSLRAGLEACFSAEHYAIEISESHGQYFARAKRTSTRPCLIESEPWQEISAAKAIALLEAVNAAIAQPENVTNGRSTTVYYAELDMPGRQLQVSSSALSREMLIELSSDSEANKSLRFKAANILSTGYHVLAHELHSLASAFESELGKKYA